MDGCVEGEGVGGWGVGSEEEGRCVQDDVRGGDEQAGCGEWYEFWCLIRDLEERRGWCKVHSLAGGYTPCLLSLERCASVVLLSAGAFLDARRFVYSQGLRWPI